MDQQQLTEKIRGWGGKRFAAVILLGAIIVWLANVIGAFGVIAELFEDDAIQPFSLTSEELQIQTEDSIGVLLGFPREWTNVRRTSGPELITGEDKYMKVAGAYPQGQGLPPALEAPGVAVLGVDATIVEPYMDLLQEAQGEGKRYEYEGADGAIVVEVVVEHNSRNVFARCIIDAKAVSQYRKGCLTVLDSLVLVRGMDAFDLHLEYKILAESNIWESRPVFFDESWTYLRANWPSYDPEVLHDVVPGSLPELPYPTSDQLIELGPTLAGRPQVFSGVVSTSQVLAPADDGRARWVIQLVSNRVPDARYYVQMNGEMDAEFPEESIVMVMNGVLVAGGHFKRTDGRIDNGLYFFAQDMLMLPPNADL